MTPARTVLVTGAASPLGSAVVGALADRDLVIALGDPHLPAGQRVRVLHDLGELERETRIDAVVDLEDPPDPCGSHGSARARALRGALDRLQRRPEVLVGRSTTAFHGPVGDAVLTERSARGPGRAARLCSVRERLLARTEVARVCLLRAGLVLGPTVAAGTERARPLVTPLTGRGGPWTPWIDWRDLVRLVLFVLDRDSVRGAVNSVAPEVVRQGALLRAAARHGAALTGLPSGPHPGGQTAPCDQLVVPAVALGAGFRFIYPTLAESLSTMRPARSQGPGRAA